LLILFFTADFTLLPTIFFRPFFNLVSKILPKKKRVKMPTKRKVVGLWPCFYATIRFLCHCSQEHILSYREKQRHQHFLLSHRADASYYHSIVSNDARRAYFYVVLRRANNNKTFFIVSHAQASEQAMTMWYCEERTSARRIAMSE
jgi:hypothetical protein